MEPDLGEKVLSGAWDPRFGDETTLLEHGWVVVQEVNNVVEEFWREIWIRHRSSRPEDDASTLALLASLLRFAAQTAGDQQPQH